MSSQKCAEVTIVLPWVHIAITPEHIQTIFNRLNWGKIESTKFIERKQTVNPRSGKVRPRHYKVFMRLVNVTKEGSNINNKLGLGKEVNVTHSRGFWKIERRDPVYIKVENDSKKIDKQTVGFNSLFLE
tara:strand:+ start:570 stop:956 length:387 start_codon:yes stop_codon:yes gene_type:complete